MWKSSLCQINLMEYEKRLEEIGRATNQTMKNDE
jgi:hypothetical protein